MVVDRLKIMVCWWGEGRSTQTRCHNLFGYREGRPRVVSLRTPHSNFEKNCFKIVCWCCVRVGDLYVDFENGVLCCVTLKESPVPSMVCCILYSVLFSTFSFHIHDFYLNYFICIYLLIKIFVLLLTQIFKLIIFECGINSICVNNNTKKVLFK